MKLWLDDIRDPVKFGHLGWVWAKTADEAIEILQVDRVGEASLDHDLGLNSCRACRLSAQNQKEYGNFLEFGCPHGEKTGYHVVCWLEQHSEFWPPLGVKVHSANPAGAARMRQVIAKHYGRNF